MGGRSDVAGVFMVLLLVLVSASPVWACTITTTIKDADGNPVTEVVVGTTVHDTAVLEGGTPYCHDPSGPTPYHCHTVIYMRYNTGDCKGSHVDETVTVTETGGVPDSGPFTPTSAGSYSYQAVYKQHSSTIDTSDCEPLTVMPACASPTYGTAHVDGNYDEWDLAEDFFAGMYRGWKYDENHPLESKLYLRYDCASGVLYVLVLAEPGVTIRAGEPGESWVKIKELEPDKRVDGNSGNDGVPPDFAWIGKSGSTAAGWEASFYLGQGTFHIIVHTKVNHDGSQTSGTLGDGLCLVISCPLPAITTSLSALEVPVGTPVTDSATLSGVTSDATGTIVFKVFSGSDTDCSGTVLFTSNAISVNGPDTYGPSTPSFTPTSVGTYRWQAFYSGDGKNNPATSACDAEILTVNKKSPSIATTLSATSPIEIGDTVYDSATLSGATSNAGGTVTYSVYSGGSCSGGALDSDTVTVTNGIVPDSKVFNVFTSAGTYSFQAVYSGDANNNGASSVCSTELLTVNKKSPSIATLLSATQVPLGTPVTDTATLSGGTNPTGTITFYVYPAGDGTCSLSPIETFTVNVDHGNGDYTSPAFTPTAVGVYQWVASYSGDGNNEPASSTCGEEALEVGGGQPSIRTVLSASVITLGESVWDSVILTGVTADPGDTVTYNVYDDPYCSVGHIVFTSTKTVVTSGVLPDSDPFTPTLVGHYEWQATYTGLLNHITLTDACGNEPLEVRSGDGQPPVGGDVYVPNKLVLLKPYLTLLGLLAAIATAVAITRGRRP